MKKALKYILLFAIFASLVTAVIWANNQANNAVCKEVDVSVLNADSIQFLTKEGIIKELDGLKINPIGKPIKSINSHKIEKALNAYDYLEDAECIIVNNRKLLIEVTQMTPVMRIFIGNKSYYVNRTGKRIKADMRFHTNVPIVYGNFNDSTFKITELIPLIEYISNDESLNTFVTAINVKNKNNIFLIPNIYGHVVNFGTPDNYESKFKKLKLMYEKVLPVKGWLAYDTISVKWDYQIVATKRNKTIKAEVAYDPEEEEVAPSIEMVTIDTPKNVENTSTKATAPKAEKTNTRKSNTELKKEKKNTTEDKQKIEKTAPKPKKQKSESTKLLKNTTEYKAKQKNVENGAISKKHKA